MANKKYTTLNVAHIKYVPTNVTNTGTKDFKDRKLTSATFIPERDFNKIAEAFTPVLAFQEKYNVPIYVGGFGVTDDAIFKTDVNGQPYNGACWLSVVINKMQEYNGVGHIGIFGQTSESLILKMPPLCYFKCGNERLALKNYCN